MCARIGGIILHTTFIILVAITAITATISSRIRLNIMNVVLLHLILLHKLETRLQHNAFVSLVHYISQMQQQALIATAEAQHGSGKFIVTFIQLL
jgi:hypothetical protein